MKFEIEQVFITMAGAALGAIMLLVLTPVLITPITTAIRSGKKAA